MYLLFVYGSIFLLFYCYLEPVHFEIGNYFLQLCLYKKYFMIFFILLGQSNIEFG